MVPFSVDDTRPAVDGSLGVGEASHHGKGWADSEHHRQRARIARKCRDDNGGASFAALPKSHRAVVDEVFGTGFDIGYHDGLEKAQHAQRHERDIRRFDPEEAEGDPGVECKVADAVECAVEKRAECAGEFSNAGDGSVEHVAGEAAVQKRPADYEVSVVARLDSQRHAHARANRQQRAENRKHVWSDPELHQSLCDGVAGIAEKPTYTFADHRKNSLHNDGRDL